MTEQKPLRIKGSAQPKTFFHNEVKSKEKLREELAEGLRIFLENGGKIQKIPPGESGVKPLRFSHKHHKMSLVATDETPEEDK